VVSRFLVRYLKIGRNVDFDDVKGYYNNRDYDAC